jgi:hypothetical protein
MLDPGASADSGARQRNEEGGGGYLGHSSSESVKGNLMDSVD